MRVWRRERLGTGGNFQGTKASSFGWRRLGDLGWLLLSGGRVDRLAFQRERVIQFIRFAWRTRCRLNSIAECLEVFCMLSVSALSGIWRTFPVRQAFISRYTADRSTPMGLWLITSNLCR